MSFHQLKAFRNRLFELFREFRIECVLLSTLLIYAGVQIIFYTTARDNAIPLWCLSVLLAKDAMVQLKPKSTVGGARFIAWVLLALVPLCLQLPGGSGLRLDALLAMLLLASAIVTYSNGLMGLLRLLPVLFLTLVIIPIQEQLFLALSFPLRLISTIVTVEPLSFFGCDISYQLTTISIGDFQIAITDACSGISQFAVLLLLGYVVVTMRRHVSLLNGLLHYLSLVPILIFANVVRLVLTIMLFYLIGEEAFSNTYHASLGFFFVILSTILLYCVGGLFPERLMDSAASKSELRDS
jgi:exosortase/archaeosortase family protein